MAAGALQTARRLGRRDPKDLAIVGFDDVPETAFYFPALTTIRQPLVELSALAVDLLTGILEQPPVPNLPVQAPAWVSPQLIVRDSSTRT